LENKINSKGHHHSGINKHLHKKKKIQKKIQKKKSTMEIKFQKINYIEWSDDQTILHQIKCFLKKIKDIYMKFFEKCNLTFFVFNKKEKSKSSNQTNTF